MPASRRLYEGKRVKVWWKSDNCSYGAIINRLSHSEVELIYEDGLRKSYRRDGSISHRISLGEVPEHVWAFGRGRMFVLVVRVGVRACGRGHVRGRGRLFVLVVTLLHTHEWDSMLNENACVRVRFEGVDNTICDQATHGQCCL